MYIQYSYVYNTCIYMYKLPFLESVSAYVLSQAFLHVLALILK